MRCDGVIISHGNEFAFAQVHQSCRRSVDDFLLIAGRGLEDWPLLMSGLDVGGGGFVLVKVVTPPSIVVTDQGHRSSSREAGPREW